MARILLVATGGTRAPSQLELMDRFLADGHEVRVMATRSARRFLTRDLVPRPWKLAGYLTRYRSSWRERIAYYLPRPKDVPHLAEGRWADVVVMCPATCNSISKLAAGFADSWPLQVLRGVPRAKRIIVVPSMNPEMWFDPTLQRALDILNGTEKYRVLHPARGRMLNGDWGVGCQVPMEDIVRETYRAIEAAPRPVAAPAAIPAEEEAPGAERDVLLVDEDVVRRRALARALRLEAPSLRVHEIDRADDAIAWCRTRTPALVLTELAFSAGPSGHDLLELLRRSGAGRVQLIATSARGRVAAGAERLSHQDVLFLPKPYDVSYAVGMVAGALRVGPRRRAA